MKIDSMSNQLNKMKLIINQKKDNIGKTNV